MSVGHSTRCMESVLTRTDHLVTPTSSGKFVCNRTQRVLGSSFSMYPKIAMSGSSSAPARYVIRINGHLGATVLSAFPAMPPRRHGAHTVLTGLLDGSALYGVLAEIEALSLDLLDVRQLEPQRKSPEPGDSRSP